MYFYKIIVTYDDVVVVCNNIKCRWSLSLSLLNYFRRDHLSCSLAD